MLLKTFSFGTQIRTFTNSNDFLQKKLIPVSLRFIPVHSGVIPVDSGPFRSIPMSFWFIPVHSVVIPVHSGPFHLIPVHSAPFRCLVTPLKGATISRGCSSTFQANLCSVCINCQLSRRKKKLYEKWLVSLLGFGSWWRWWWWWWWRWWRLRGASLTNTLLTEPGAKSRLASSPVATSAESCCFMLSRYFWYTPRKFLECIRPGKMHISIK